MIHELKIDPKYFVEIQEMKKTFEVRKNDRNFAVGDFLALNEFKDREYTGRSLLMRVIYVMDTPDFCKGGYVIMSIIPCAITDRYEHFQPQQYPVIGVPIYGRRGTIL